MRLRGASVLMGRGAAPAPARPTPLTIPVAEILRAPCPRPPRPMSPSVGELAGFSVEQEAAISVCEMRKDAAVATIEAHNRLADAPAASKRPWWRRWL